MFTGFLCFQNSFANVDDPYELSLDMVYVHHYLISCLHTEDKCITA